MVRKKSQKQRPELALEDDNAHDGDVGLPKRLRLFNVEACGMRRGVPAGLNLRVYAESAADARRKAKSILDEFAMGVDLFKAWGRSKDSDSLRLYLDGSLMSKKVMVALEDYGFDDDHE